MIEEKRIDTKGMTLYQALHRIAKEQLRGRVAYFDSAYGKTWIVIKSLR
ncbi:MAG: hypothetical protein ACTSUF_03390 [Candidatus Heimdallarchaeaceae archaeon]